MTTQESSATGGIKVTSSVSLTTTRNLILPAGNFQFLAVENATSGGQSIQVIGPTGTGATIPNGATATVWFDGTNVVIAGGGLGGSISPSPLVTQTVIQPPGTSLNVNRLDGVYNVEDWCTVAGTYDDTCFSNAIADVVLNGNPSFAGHRTAKLVVSARQFTFNHTVTVPAGINLGIHGDVSTGAYGSEIALSAGVDGFIILSDNVDIKNITFLQVTSPHSNAINLGSSSVTVFDSHINWCWFAGPQVAIHLVNVSGLDLSHNTFDSGGSYGIYANNSTGDVQAADIIASDIRGYANVSAVYIRGDGTDGYSDFKFSGIFDHNQAGTSATYFSNLRSVQIQGDFNNNLGYDVQMNAVNGGVIGPFTSHNNAIESVLVQASQNVTVADGSIVNTGLGYSTPTGSTIDIQGSGHTDIHGVSSLSISGSSTGKNLYGLSVDSASLGTRIFGNYFNAQTTAQYHVLDTTVSTSLYGVIDTSMTASTSPICPNGPNGQYTTTGCAAGGATSPATSALLQGTGTANGIQAATTAAITNTINSVACVTGSSCTIPVPSPAGSTGQVQTNGGSGAFAAKAIAGSGTQIQSAPATPVANGNVCVGDGAGNCVDTGHALTALGTSGQIPIGNTGGTAYVPQTITGDSTLTATGVMTNTGINTVQFSALGSGIVRNTTTTGQPSIETAAQMATDAVAGLKTLTNCNTSSGYYLSPFSGACVLASPNPTLTALSGTTPAITATLNNWYTITLTANTTPTISGIAQFDRLFFHICQPATAVAWTWPTAFRSPPIIDATNTGNTCTNAEFRSLDGTTLTLVDAVSGVTP